MIAFDTDVFTDLMVNAPRMAERLAGREFSKMFLPVVVDEVLRGRLNVVRQAEAGKAKVSLSRAYELFALTIERIAEYPILRMDPSAKAMVEMWRKQGVRVAANDTRIAAICVFHRVTLVTRNQRDFANFPALALEVWD